MTAVFLSCHTVSKSAFSKSEDGVANQRRPPVKHALAVLKPLPPLLRIRTEDVGSLVRRRSPPRVPTKGVPVTEQPLPGWPDFGLGPRPKK